MDARTEHARTFQHHWNHHLESSQSPRAIDDVTKGDYYGIDLCICDITPLHDARVASLAHEQGFVDPLPAPDEVQAFSLQLLREAVELLHILAWIDLELWRHVFIETFCLKEQWIDHVVPVWAFMPYDPLKQSVEVADSDVVNFFAILSETPRTSQFTKSMQLMTEILGLETRPQLQHLVPTHMEMALMLTPEVPDSVPPDKLSQHLRTMELTARLLRENGDTSVRMPIHITSMLVTVVGNMDVVDAQCLVDLAALSATTSLEYNEMHLRLAETDMDTPPVRVSFKRFLDHVALDRTTPTVTRH